MFSIGEWMYDIFGPDSAALVIMFVFLIFFIDALFFPTLPELFFIIGFMYSPSLLFGLQLLTAVVIAEVLGIALLYWIVEHIRVPGRIKRIADRYVNFLICNDERMLLVNRVAPMIPFAGAFVSLVDSWRLDRALFYVVLGCVLKYGAIMLMSSFFYAYFSDGTAQTFTVVFIIAVIVVSIAFAFVRKRRLGFENS